MRDLLSLGLSVAVFAGFLGYYGLLCFRHSWGGDFQMYMAAASRLYVDFADPPHEALALPHRESSLYTPYLVVVAGFGRLLGASPYRALEWAGLFNLLFYVLSINYFFSRHSLHYRYRLPAACFLLVTLWVRWAHFGWSSETSLLTFAFIQAYPSTFGWGLAFVAFALLVDVQRRITLARFLCLTLTLTLLVTCHLLTASWVLGVLLIQAAYARIVHQRRWLLPLVGAALLLSLGLAALWPYGSLFGHVATTGIHEPSQFGLNPFLDFAVLYALALPAALIGAYRLKRHGAFLCGFLATTLALYSWRALGISFGNRYALFMAFFAQFLVAEALALGLLVIARARVSLKCRLRSSRFERGVLVGLVLIAVAGPLGSPMWQAAFDPGTPAALVSPARLLRLPAPEAAYYARHRELRPYLRAGDVVMMPTSRDAFDLAVLTGARFVSAPGAIRARDVAERFAAANLFFRPGTSAPLRSLLLARYGVTRVLVPQSYAALLPELSGQLGAPIHRDASYSVFDVSRWQGLGA